MDLRNKVQHMQPKKPQYSPHKHLPIDYGATQQLVQPTDTSPLLNEKRIKRIQGIVGALMYVGRAINNKLLVELIAIGAQQAAATEDTAAEIEQLLDYVATHPNDGILFRKRDMILAANTCNLKTPNIRHTNTAPSIMDQHNNYCNPQTPARY